MKKVVYLYVEGDDDEMVKTVMNENVNPNKSERWNQEYSRLCKVFGSESQEKQVLLQPIFGQMANLIINMDKANLEIDSNGGVEVKDGKRDVSARLEAYCKMVDMYQDLLKQVQDITNS